MEMGLLYGNTVKCLIYSELGAIESCSYCLPGQDYLDIEQRRRAKCMVYCLWKSIKYTSLCIRTSCKDGGEKMKECSMIV
jgi:hypothetical protein